MIRTNYTGARGSNAGDDYHELWALQHALSLLEHDTQLRALTVEGIAPEASGAQSKPTWDGVDCALYYGGTCVSDSDRIVVEQLKYSGADPDAAWSLSRLTATTAKTRDNSIIRRLAETFENLRNSRGGSSTGISLRLVSNQPVAPSVIKTLKPLGEPSVAKKNKQPRNHKSEALLVKATGLSGTSLQDFVRSLDVFTRTGSRFLIEEAVLKSISDWTDDDARSVLKELLNFIRKRMLPESELQPITRETMLLQFGFSKREALFPCPPELQRVTDPVLRNDASRIVRRLVEGEKLLCLHGAAGCGKTTMLQEIEALLPPRSVVVVFDCYGAGSYLDSDAYRHRPKDAFLELSNDLALRSKIPLLLTRSKDADYPRAFRTRINHAAEAVASQHPKALLLIAVDAADNSVTAAASRVPPEPSFISDFVNLGALPDNVRLVVTARTARLVALDLPARFKQMQIGGFTRDETKANVGRIWPDVPDAWIDDFHYFSGGSPRVQAYAIKNGETNPLAALNSLRFGQQVANISDLFDRRLGDAFLKSGRAAVPTTFLAALIALPRPIPVSDLAAISGLPVEEVTDVCVDSAPAFRTLERINLICR